MKKIFLLFLVCQMAFGLAAQSRFQDPVTGKWGYWDREWNILAPAIYDEVQPNFDTIMAVKKDGKMAALDDHGQYRIPLIYEQIVPNFNNFRSQYGYAAVTKNTKILNSWGMVDSRGKVILPEKFQYVRAVTPQLLAAKLANDSLIQFFDLKGRLLYTISGRNLEPLDIDNTCFGIRGLDRIIRSYKTDGTPVYPPDPAAGVWTDGALTILSKGPNQQGMINAKGETVIPFEFYRILHGLPGHFIVEKRDEKYAYGGMGVYDKNGNAVIPVGHLSVMPFGKVYRLNDLNADKNGILAADGTEILPAQYHFSNVHISESNYGKAMPASHPERYISATDMETRQQFLIRDDGMVIRPKGSQAVIYYAENYPLIVDMIPADDKTFPKKIAIDFSGKMLLPAEYQWLNFTPDPGILLGTKEQFGKVGFIHLNDPGKAAFIYEHSTRFSNGYFRMAAGNQYDLYNPQLTRIHSGEYNWLNEPNKDQFEQFRANKTKGKLVAVAFRQGMTNGEWLAITESGKEFLFKKPEEKPAAPPPSKPAEPVEEVVLEEMDIAVKEAPPPLVEKAAEQIFHLFDLQQAPEYPGGKDSLDQYLIRNLKYPRAAAENGIQGMSVVRFVIERDGSISNINLVRDIGGGCGAEAKRLVEAMAKWAPGRKNGKPVRVEYTMPVKFKLE